MRRKYTDYLVIVISVLTVLVSAFFALSQTQAGAILDTPTAEGAALFAFQCASCHTVSEGAGPLVDAEDSTAARAELTSFLAEHGGASEDEVSRIVDFLAQMVQQTTGEELFAAKCASCHTVTEGAGPLVGAEDADAARAELSRFLAEHGGALEDEIPALVAYLAQAVQDDTDTD